MVVGEQHADHRAGTSSSTVVPLPGDERIASVPPACSTSPVEQRQPDVALRARAARAPRGAKPRPSSVDDEARRARRAMRVTSTLARTSASRVRLHVADRLARDAVDERVVRSAPPGASSTCERRSSTPAASSGLSRSLSATSQARRLEVRRMDLDQQRAQVAHALAQRADRVAQDAAPPPGRRGGRPRRRAARARTRRRRGPARRRRGGRRRSGRRSCADASTALASSSSRSRWPRCSRRAIDQASGTWKSSSTSSPPSSGGASAPQQPLAARVHRAEPLVDLEQHLACRSGVRIVVCASSSFPWGRS